MFSSAAAPKPHARQTQESHCAPIEQLSFNFAEDDCSNLFVTVGKDQVCAVFEEGGGSALRRTNSAKLAKP